MENFNSSCFYSHPHLSWNSWGKVRRVYFENFWKDMKKGIFLIFTGYIWTKTLLGLTFHPFTTIRQVTRRPVLLPVILTPIIGLISFFIFGRIGAFLVDFYGISRTAISIFLSTFLMSILFWQALLIYLLLNFLIASWRK